MDSINNINPSSIIWLSCSKTIQMYDDVVQIEFLPDQHLQNYKYTLVHSYINLKEQNNVY